ncbi:Ubiquitin carboxyl-terminal hydrolase [Phytophthora cinnamomi]|uniref:Ubiquitin carboxyl-terminal hydrolase n=1 Tax=Phytophthora cinnamomi TaxID=4785 RepID=UPI0035594948|nr:Ubiquitin carboxyl-terminal hydrolase [Phytophthora cinnamomi]
MVETTTPPPMPPQLMARSKRFLYGATAAACGTFRALADSRVRDEFWRSMKVLLVMSAVLSALLHVLLLPVELISSLFLSPETVDASVRAFRYAAASTVPFLLVSVCRYVSVDMFEKAFFAGLATHDAALAQTIRQKKAIYWDWEYVRHLGRFGLRQLGFGLVALVAKPLLGVLIPIAQFGYRIRHMEVAFLVPIFIAFVFPATREAALQLVHLWLDSRAMIRELYDPIIARLKSAAKSGDPNVSTDLLTDMEIDSEEHDSRAEQRDWHQSGSDAARLGFGLVFCYMQQIPFLGPFAWFMGFASAGLFAPELVDLSAFGGSSKKMT